MRYGKLRALAAYRQHLRRQAKGRAMRAQSNWEHVGAGSYWQVLFPATNQNRITIERRE